MNKRLVESAIFPSHSISDLDKATEEYGLSVGKAIQYEWFKRAGATCKYYDQWRDYHLLRLYARGEQPVEKYKTEFAIEGDLSYTNLDWTPIPIISKFVDIVANGISNRDYEIKARAEDALSADKKNKFQEMVESDMLSKDVLEITKQEWGVDAFNIPPEELPATDQELELYMQIKYKPSTEIACEVSISNILNMNDFISIKERCDIDVITLGVAWVKHSFCPSTGLKIEYVDPAYIVHSYTESPTFEDVFYYGEVKQVHYSEIRKINPSVTDDELETLKAEGIMWVQEYGGYYRYHDELYKAETVPMLFFNYKTTMNTVYKEKTLNNGGKRVIKRDDTFDPSEEDMLNNRFAKVSKTIDVWYDGVMVLGSCKLLKWELQKNMVRPKSASQKVYPNYIGIAPRAYKGSYDSLVRRMIPFADQIQFVHLKLQHILSRLVPDGIYIDADGINEVDLGTGAAYNPEDALKLYFQTGSIIGRSMTQDGEFNHGKIPIQEIGKGDSLNKINSLINQYNHYLNMIRDVTGINEAVDGSRPDSYSLVGLQKLAAANSNTATRHILKGGFTLTKRLSEACINRTADILEYADFKEEFAMQIGKYNLSILNDIKTLYLYSFGIYLEVAPDEEEKANMEGNIQTALQQGMIDLDDAIDIRQIKNIKLANELLKVKKKKRNEARMAEEQKKMEMQTVMNTQSSQAAAESKMQVFQLEAQAKLQAINAEAQAKIQVMQAEVAAKKELMETEFQYNMQLKGLESQALMNKEKEKEDRKDERVKKQGTVQSKLIDQRKKDSEPINFESNEDTMDGFDLGEFEPR